MLVRLYLSLFLIVAAVTCIVTRILNTLTELPIYQFKPQVILYQKEIEVTDKKTTTRKSNENDTENSMEP